MKVNIQNQWLTLKDVCKYVSLSPSTIFRAIQKGELRVSKKTGKLLFKKEWIDSFLGGENGTTI